MRTSTLLTIGLLTAGLIISTGCGALRDKIRKNHGGTGSVKLAAEGGITATNQQPDNPADGSSSDAREESKETTSTVAVATNSEPVMITATTKNKDGSVTTTTSPALDKHGEAITIKTAVFATNAPPNLHTKELHRKANTDTGKAQKTDYIEEAKGHFGALWAGVFGGIIVALGGIFLLFDTPPIVAIMPNKFKYLMIVGGTVTAIVCYMLAEHIGIVLGILGSGLAVWFLVDFAHEHGNVKAALNLMKSQAESERPLATQLLSTATEIKPIAPEQPPQN